MPESNPFDFPGINVKWGQAAGGGLAGTYPNPTVAKINGATLGTTTATTGNLLIADGSSWVTKALSGYGTILSTGVLTVTKVKGTTTNDNATAGDVGEYVESIVASGSAVALTTGTAANVTSISLTAGDWDVEGMIYFTGAGTTTVSFLGGTISTTSATTPAFATGALGFAGLPHNNATQFNNFGSVEMFSTGVKRISISGTTTTYMVALASFGTSTCSAYGGISARRVR